MTGLVTSAALSALVGGAKEKAKSALGWITEDSAHLLLAMLGIALLWGWWGHHEAAKYKRVVASMEVAQKKAEQDQVAVNHEPAKKSAEIAEKSNAEAPAYYHIVRVAAAANSVRPAACPVSAPDLSGANPPVESLLGPDAAAGMVCRPAVEDSQIIDAAARGAEMRQEALDWIEMGLATPAP